MTRSPFPFLVLLDRFGFEASSTGGTLAAFLALRPLIARPMQDKGRGATVGRKSERLLHGQRLNGLALGFRHDMVEAHVADPFPVQLMQPLAGHLATRALHGLLRDARGHKRPALAKRGWDCSIVDAGGYTSG